MSPSKWIFSILCLLLASSVAWGQHFKIHPKNLHNTSLEDSVVVYTQLAELNLDDHLRKQIENKLSDRPSGRFLKLNLQNLDQAAGAIYLRFCRIAEEVQVFRFQDDSLISQHLNTADKHQGSILPSTHYYYHLSLGAGQRQDIVIYLQFSEDNKDPHYHEVLLYNAQEIESDYFEKSSIQSFYAGLILLIVGLSLVSAWALKYRPLLFFGLHMLFWIPYFQIQNNLLGVWDFIAPSLNIFQQSTLTIAFLIAFANFFTSEFLRLKERIGKWYYGYFALNALAFVLLLVSTFGPLLTWINYLLALVILQTLVLSIYLSLKGFKAAKQLLLSIGFLLFGALAMSLSQIGLLPISWITTYLFQLGTLVFSLILFYSLAARVTKIREDRKEAEQLIKIKSRFFEDISHELRSPLSLVLDPVRKVYSELPSGDQKEALKIAKNAGEGLQALVNQILDLSRHEFKAPPLVLKEQDLNAFLRTQYSQYSSLALSRQITLEYAGPSSAVVCAFDAEKMQQIIANLLSNALKFTPAGGQVELRLKDLVDTLLISVSDTGAGISTKAKAHIFERFYQDPDAPPTAQPGTGIGLALCKALVEQHQGEIRVESELQKGSTFSILLPKLLSPSAPRPIEETKIKDAPSPEGKPLILVAEDHPDLRAYLHQCLKLNYEVILAKNGAEAWEIALDQQPDIIVSDLMMPDLNGIELTQKVKAHKETCHIPVLLLTAKSEQDAVNEGLAAGAVDYMAKPFNSEELLLRLSNILKQLETWRQKVAELDLPKVAENTLNKVDRDFLENLEEALVREYSNPEFGVEDLASEIGMSKTHLNRKLNVLIGHSASKLIQNYRLNEARKMLLEKQGNVSEIAFSCGFNSPAYFVKCFKDKYQETPGQLL